MVDLCWSEKGGWHRPRVSPYGPIPLDPAAAVLHYSQEIFEGLKAYRHADGSIWTFRPDRNAARLQRSARRLALPELPTELFIESLRQLVAVDSSWVPSNPEESLYLRPFMFAKEAFLGVRAAKKVGYYLIASPAGAYFPGGVQPVNIWLSTDYARAGHGGTGAAKTGGNYASSLLPQEEAYKKGCQQVLFLDGEYIEELGGMNLVLVTRDGRAAHAGLRLASSRASRSRRSWSSRRTAVSRSSSAGSRSTSGARVRHPARSSAPSPAARPRWWFRSAR